MPRNKKEQISRCLNCQSPLEYCTGNFTTCGRPLQKSGRPVNLSAEQIGPFLRGEVVASEMARVLNVHKSTIFNTRRKLRTKDGEMRCENKAG